MTDPILSSELEKGFSAGELESIINELFQESGRGGMKGKFVMVDGLDGSGKGVIVDALVEWAEAKQLKVLNVGKVGREQEFPISESVAYFDVLRTDEPTFYYVGKAIREELIRANGRNYSAWSVAQAFALDREILYRRLIIPALKQGKYIFQERGVVSSIVYQPLQERIPLSEILKLPGNKLALQYPPDLLIIPKVSAETAMKRLGPREKKDESIFETLSFQRKLAERYSSEWLKQLFEKQGTKIVYLDTEEPKTAEETRQETVRVWEEFLKV